MKLALAFVALLATAYGSHESYDMEDHVEWATDLLNRLMPQKSTFCLDAETHLQICMGQDQNADLFKSAFMACSMSHFDEFGDTDLDNCQTKDHLEHMFDLKLCMLTKMNWLTENYQLDQTKIEEFFMNSPVMMWLNPDVVSNCMMLGDMVNMDNIEGFVSQFLTMDIDTFLSQMGLGWEQYARMLASSSESESSESAESRKGGKSKGSKESKESGSGSGSSEEAEEMGHIEALVMNDQAFIMVVQNLVRLQCLQRSYDDACSMTIKEQLYMAFGLDTTSLYEGHYVAAGK